MIRPAARFALWGGKRPPYQCELEYIQGTGTQYIDTGYVPTHDSAFEVTFSPDNVDFVQHPVYGNAFAHTDKYSPQTQSPATLWTGNGYNNRFFYSAVAYSSYQVGDIYTVRQSKDGLVIDGVNVGGYSGLRTALNEPMWLFGFAGSQSDIWYGLLKMYRWRAYESGVLVADYIPVLDWNGEAKMFDRVTGTYPDHYGTFVAGPEIHAVEYIQSTGTQFIDTGVIPTTGTAFEVSAAFTDLTVGRFGAITSPGDIRYYFGVASGKWIGGVKSTSYDHNIATADTLKHLFKIDDTGLYIDGVKRINAGADAVTTSFYLFNVHGSNANLKASAKLYGCNITRSGTDIGKQIPIRVGSGSTFEGALLDTVERRVYRNAGTGAFLYGNDV